MPNRIFRMTTTPYRLSKKSRLLSYRLPVTFVGSSCSWLCWSKTKIPAMLWDAGFALIFLPFSFFSGKSKGEGCSKGSCRTNIFPKHWRGSSSQRNSKAAAVEQQYPSMILNLTPSATNHSFEVLGAGSLYRDWLGPDYFLPPEGCYILSRWVAKCKQKHLLHAIAKFDIPTDWPFHGELNGTKYDPIWAILGTKMAKKLKLCQSKC